MANEIDINENNLLLQYPEVLQTLLRDHSRFDHLREKLRRAGKDPKEAEGREDECHIIWATDDYESFGEGFSFHDQHREHNRRTCHDGSSKSIEDFGRTEPT